jgi:hypothetical protein
MFVAVKAGVCLWGEKSFSVPIESFARAFFWAGPLGVGVDKDSLGIGQLPAKVDRGRFARLEDGVDASKGLQGVLRRIIATFNQHHSRRCLLGDTVLPEDICGRSTRVENEQEFVRI